MNAAILEAMRDQTVPLTVRNLTVTIGDLEAVGAELNADGTLPDRNAQVVTAHARLDQLAQEAAEAAVATAIAKAKKAAECRAFVATGEFEVGRGGAL